MPKHKPAKAQGSRISQSQTLKEVQPSIPNTTSLNEDGFQDLQNKISARLKGLDQKAATKQKELARARNEAADFTKGKKRAADGTIITSRKRTTPTNQTPGKTQHQDNDEDLEFEDAVKELGGTQEDLDLIAGAESESELEGLDGGEAEKQGSRKKGSSLEDGMANILKEIALAQGNKLDDSIESEQSEGEEKAIEEPAIDKAEAQGTRISKQNDRPIKRSIVDSRLKFQPQADWFNYYVSEVDLNVPSKYVSPTQTIEQLHRYAKSLLATDNETFKSTQQTSSSQSFYNTVIASGTLSDKISALTLAVQESPVHNVRALENLIGLAGKRNRGQAVDVLRALKDLLAQGSLLPSDRRLYTFATQPVLLHAAGSVKSWKEGDKLPRGLTDSNLIAWAFEDWLKLQYFEILKILEVWCSDEIEFSKSRAISYVFELLKEKPEQESNLLRLLVNKLGDPTKKIASQTSYLLMQLLSMHPAMKMVVISAMEADFIFRPGQSMHGKYYAIVTLNQTTLSSREEDVAQKLLDIYFGLFATLLKSSKEDVIVSTATESKTRAQRQRKKKDKGSENLQEEELREKLTSAVLTGVNRAYPYVGAGQKEFTNHLETLFKITHSANFNTSLQAMLLIQQLISTHSASADRFYRTLYESLLDPRLVVASKQQLYLNLLHRSLKADVNMKRLKAFVKRLLQILSLHEPSFICGVFFLLKDLEKSYPSLSSLIDQPEDHEDEEEAFHDVDEDKDADNEELTRSQAKTTVYDGNKRAPEHANADNSCVWEVLPFLVHFHPSVLVSADHYIQHEKLPGKPDLSLHTLIHFLDRFVYRNPKLGANKLRGSSIMQPLASDDTHAVLISSNTRQALPAVNTDEFKHKKDEDIAADDVFFHKYFTTLGKDSKTRKRKDHDIDKDGSIGDEGEDAVWKAMMDSAPDLEGEVSEDEDLDMSDFEEEMGEGLDLSDDDRASLDGQVEDDGDGDEEVDIEAGIFDDSDNELGAALEAQAGDGESDFEGLDSDADEKDHQSQKRKEKRKAEKDNRKKMKALPTFASAADYAKMLEDDEDEDLG